MKESSRRRFLACLLAAFVAFMLFALSFFPEEAKLAVDQAWNVFAEDEDRPRARDEKESQQHRLLNFS